MEKMLQPYCRIYETTGDFKFPKIFQKDAGKRGHVIKDFQTSAILCEFF